MLELSRNGDASPSDASPSDASPSDASPKDATPTDTRSMDAGPHMVPESTNIGRGPLDIVNARWRANM